MREEIVSFAEAVDRVLRAANGSVPLEKETVPLALADGRILAEPLCADRDQPPFDRSTRDGFAVWSGAKREARTLRVLGTLPAGAAWAGAPLREDEAVEIMTGAPLPEGADAVVMVEHVAAAEGRVTVAAERWPEAGSNVVRRGTELQAGAVAVAAGERLRAAEIALAAAVGAAEVQVWKRPRVAIVATGDELVELDDVPAATQIRNSNTYALAALVRAAGGAPQPLPVTRDSLPALRSVLDEALAGSDLLLLSGGVSAGKFDLVEQALAERDAESHFTGVRMQPGKPVVFGFAPGPPRVPFFGLPGNPISTQVTFRALVEPLLRRLGGEPATPPRFLLARLAAATDARPGLTRLLPARLGGSLLEPTVTLVPWQGSGDQAANARADCYALLAEDRTVFAAGDTVPVLLR